MTLIVPRERTPSTAEMLRPGPVLRRSRPDGTGEERPSGARLRLVLADDHRIIRQALAAALSQEPDFEIVGEAEDGRTAVSLARDLRPDVVVMDVSMPRLDGIEATRRIVGRVPGVQVVALSMHDEASKNRAMLEAGAVAYVTKSAPVRELIRAVRKGVAAPAAEDRQSCGRPARRSRRIP